MASLYLAKGDEEAVNKVVMKALQVAPDDADTVLNGAALMWETEFRRVEMGVVAGSPFSCSQTARGRLN